VEPTNRIVVLTALPLERSAVRALLKDPERHDLPNGTIVHEAPVADTMFTVCLASTGQGNQQAALVAQSVITWAHPTAVFFVGVAGSLKSDVVVGDVVVATQVVACGAGKITAEGLKARPAAWDSAHGLVQAAQEAVSTGSWLQFLPHEAGPTPRVHFKPIAAGSTVKDAADSWYSDFLDTRYNNATAIETEGAGAALAAHHAGIRLMVIRGISDPADGTKAASDAAGAQERAAQYAAALAFGTIVELPAPLGANQAFRKADDLVQLESTCGPFDQAHGVQADRSANVAYTRDMRSRVNTRLAVARCGQCSAPVVLPPGETNRAVHHERLAARLTALIEVLLEGREPIPEQIARVAGLAP
jgi:adenosylhomocysteine nucleosidase